MANIRPLSDKLQKIAIDELHEVPDRINDDLLKLKDWIAKTPHLNSRTDDQFLLSFLRGCKFSLEKTKEKLDNHFTLKSLCPEIYANRDPLDPRLQELMKYGISLPLSIISETDPPIIMSRLGCYDSVKFSITEASKIIYLIADVMVKEQDISAILGHTVIVDLQGMGFALMSQMTPSIIKKWTLSMEAYPIRTKAIHIVNAPKGFDTILKIFMSFAKEKIRRRVFMHDSFDSLHKIIPKSVLPKEYGGSADTVEEICEFWKQKLIANRDYLLEDENYGVIENLRTGPAKDAFSLFGVDGSFRSLNID